MDVSKGVACVNCLLGVEALALLPPKEVRPALTMMPTSIQQLSRAIEANLLICHSTLRKGKQSLFACKSIQKGDSLLALEILSGWHQTKEQAEASCSVLLNDRYLQMDLECKALLQCGSWFAAGSSTISVWPLMQFVDSENERGRVGVNCLGLSFVSF